jgi:cell division protease FtsH
VSLPELAADTFGMSGAHLENVANEAAIMALRENVPEITPAHLHSAIEKVMMGEKLDKIPQPQEKKRVAVHEAGHAIVSETLLPNSVASVNVASRSNALGYVRQTQEDDMYLYTAEYLKNKIAVALAGAVAEEVILGSRSTGASSDFKQASQMAKHLIFGGMSSLGIISQDDLPQNLLHTTISEILKEIETYTIQVLTDKKDTLESVMNTLLDKECLTGAELRTLLKAAA